MVERTLSFAGTVDDFDIERMPVFYGHVRFDTEAPPSGTDPATGAAVYSFEDPDARLVIDGEAYDATAFEILVGDNVAFGGVFVVDSMTLRMQGDGASQAFALDVGYAQLGGGLFSGTALPASLPPFQAQNAFGTTFFAEAVAAEPLRAVTTDFGLFAGEIGAGISETAARLVAYLYEAGLDRDGTIDEAGLNFWIDRVEAGLSERDLASAFLASTEFTASFGAVESLSEEALIDRLYQNVLNREPDDEGRAFWRDVAERPGIDEEALLIAFANSPENIEGSPFVQGLVELSPGEWSFI